MQGHFEACALRRFSASLLPAAVVEVAVVICLKSLFFKRNPSKQKKLQCFRLEQVFQGYLRFGGQFARSHNGHVVL